MDKNLIKRKKYFKKHHKKIKIISSKSNYAKTYSKRDHSRDLYKYFFKNIIKIIILLIICVCIGVFEFDNIKSNSSYNEIKIIESKEYKNFDKMKNKITDPFFFGIMKEISLIKYIYTDKTKKHKKGKNIIHITVSLDNEEDYKYVLYVSMYSLLYNCNKRKTFVIYHLLCSPDFTEKSTDIFKPLVSNYSQNVELIFYNMGNFFMNRNRNGYPPATFYRVFTPLFIDSDRIIHLDGDCLILTDLYEMYNLNFKGNYIFGFYDILADGVDYLGINSTVYINAGVILLNLKKIRRDKKVHELLNITTNPDFLLKKNAQTAMNYLFYPKIGRLPSKYGIFNFEDKSDLNVYLNFLRTKIPIEELEDALNNPGIVHLVLCHPKPWSNNPTYYKSVTYCKQRHNCSCKKYFDLFHFYAQKTEYYEHIKKFCGVKHILL